MIFMVILILISIHLAIPYIYYIYMKKISQRPWNISINKCYEPKISLIIATYNESAVIENKLKNVREINYPYKKIEVIIVDSASTDNTVSIAKKFITNNKFPFEIKILEEKERRGKAKALNFALRHTKNQIIATSDADSFWEPSALKKAVSYLADPQVGAVTGKEEFLNLKQNELTLAEGMYRQLYNVLRIGESKIHSTLFFQGELSIYKRGVFKKFNDTKGSDDCGTIKNIIADGYRTIFVPEAVFSDLAPYTLNGRINLKVRRALHLLHALITAVKLKRENRFPQPSYILYTNLFIHLINPFLSIALLAGVAYIIYVYPLLLLLSITIFFLKTLRILFLLYITSNLALIIAVLRYVRGEEQIIWKKIDEMRDRL